MHERQRNAGIGSAIWPRLLRRFRFRRVSLDARAERFAAIARVHPPGCKSNRAHLRGDVYFIGQLRSCAAAATCQRAGSGCPILENSAAESTLGSVAISRGQHFRTRAAGALLKR